MVWNIQGVVFKFIVGRSRSIQVIKRIFEYEIEDYFNEKSTKVFQQFGINSFRVQEDFSAREEREVTSEIRANPFWTNPTKSKYDNLDLQKCETVCISVSLNPDSGITQQTKSLFNIFKIFQNKI